MRGSSPQAEAFYQFSIKGALKDDRKSEEKGMFRCHPYHNVQSTQGDEQTETKFFGWWAWPASTEKSGTESMEFSKISIIGYAVVRCSKASSSQPHL